MADDELHDDEIEVVDLSHQEKNDNDASITPARRISLRRSRFTFEQRRRQVMITATVVVVGLIVLLSSILPLHSLWSPSQATPTPPGRYTVKKSSHAGLYYFQPLPSWGTLWLDGKPVPHIPTSDDTEPLAIEKGVHHLVWKAEAFQPLECTVVVLSTSDTQTCAVRALEQSYSNTVPQISLLSFPKPLSLQHLQSGERQPLIREVQRLLDTLQGEEVVAAGERYAYNHATRPPLIATTAQRASLRFLLETDPSRPNDCEGIQFDRSCSVAGEDCRLFCTIEWPIAEGKAAEGWDVVGIVRPTWSYEHSELVDETGRQGDQQFVALHISRQQQRWSVSFHHQGESSFDDPNCISTIGAIVTNPSYTMNRQTHQNIHWEFISGSNRAWGCLVRGSIIGSSPAAPSADSDLFLIQRFGVLLAASPQAHKLWPALPQLDAQAQQVVQEIEAHLAFIS